jgi:hypothetical protein
MAGKQPVFCSKPLNCAMQNLSKNQLIDYVVDSARMFVGEDATDDQVLDYIQGRMETVWHHRGDRAVSLAEKHAAYVRASEAYQQAQHRSA